MNHRYWLHRISHKSEVSYPLLDIGYLSIGFSDFLSGERFLENMLGNAEDKWDLFEQENKRVWGEKLYRTRYNLWRFLCEFSTDDCVIVPSWGTFSIYKIAGKPTYAGHAITAELECWYGKKVHSGENDNRYLLDEENNRVDIGFVIPVEPVNETTVNIPRSDYAENALLSRMKIQQTNANIDDLASQIETAIERAKKHQPINIYSETIDLLSKPLNDVIKRIVDNDQFERLIKCYFEKIGADFVQIPSKRDGKGEADGDIIARFDTLKLLIYVQAKHHTGTTGEWAVHQISEYTDQKGEEASDPEYNSISWVISSAEDFSKEAHASALEKNVRLINGNEFSKMLIDAGLAKLATEFSQNLK